MKCPNCYVNLLIAERVGVEIDYCPDCRGVWLDKGELDKIIEKSLASAAADRAPDKYPQADRVERHYEHDHHGHGHHDEHGEYRRRRNWLSNLFD